MGYSEIQDYAFYAQYILLFIYLIWEVKSTKFNIERRYLILFLALFYTSIIPVVTGYIRGYDPNLKPIILTLILVVAISSKLQLPIKRLLNFLILFIFVEYILHFTVLPVLHLYRTLGPLDLIRPIGPVIDMHLTSLLLAFLGFSSFRNKYFAMGITAITMNIQALLVSLFLTISSVNFKSKIDNFSSKVRYKRQRLSAFFASGDWINFMNAGDCFYDTEVLNNVYKNDDHSDVQIIFGNHQVRYSSGRKRFVAAGLVENYIGDLNFAIKRHL